MPVPDHFRSRCRLLRIGKRRLQACKLLGEPVDLRLQRFDRGAGRPVRAGLGGRLLQGGDTGFERCVVDDCCGRRECCDLVAQGLQFTGDVLLDAGSAAIGAKSGDDARILQAAEAKQLEQAPPVPLLDPTGKALDGFFAALARTEQKQPGAITRIAHFGDSIIVSDYVSGTLRRKLQATFGDAGHGFVLIANAWPAYFHNDVSRYATAGFNVSRIVGPYAADGLYGLGANLHITPRPSTLCRRRS